MKHPLALVLPFRPVSTEDFNRYAKSLSRLIEEPLQDSQKLLAEAYGYRNREDLQTRMAEPGKPGPFDAEVWLGMAGHAEAQQYWQGIQERGNRLLDLVAKLKKVQSARFLSSRCLKVRDLGLFEVPALHRDAAHKILGTIDVLEGKELLTAAGDRREVGIDAYVHIDKSGPAIARFTRKGAILREALHEIFPYRQMMSGSVTEAEINEEQRKALDIYEAHPDFPWPLAYIVTEHARLLAQEGWADNPGHLERGGFIVEDAPAQLPRAMTHNARILLPYVEDAVAKFNPLYEGVTTYASTRQHSKDADAFTWPSLLYWGGRVAMNAGRHALALKLLKKAWLVAGHDDAFGIRYPLSALYLVAGEGDVTSLFPRNPDNIDAWAYMATAASLATTHPSAAVTAYVEAALQCYGVVEIFNSGWRACRALRILNNHNLPIMMQEFRYHTTSFWLEHPAADALFMKVAHHHEFLKAITGWHKAETSNYGTMGKPVVNHVDLARLKEQVVAAAEAAISS